MGVARHMVHRVILRVQTLDLLRGLEDAGALAGAAEFFIQRFPGAKVAFGSDYFWSWLLFLFRIAHVRNGQVCGWDTSSWLDGASKNARRWNL